MSIAGVPITPDSVGWHASRWPGAGVKTRRICETRLEVEERVQCAKEDTLAFRAVLECRTFRQHLFLGGLRRD
jgi:hypothetical protein